MISDTQSNCKMFVGQAFSWNIFSTKYPIYSKKLLLVSEVADILKFEKHASLSQNSEHLWKGPNSNVFENEFRLYILSAFCLWWHLLTCLSSWGTCCHWNLTKLFTLTLRAFKHVTTSCIMKRIFHTISVFYTLKLERLWPLQNSVAVFLYFLFFCYSPFNH